MTKATNRWICKSCQIAQSKWTGSCPQCKEWNSFEQALAPSFKGTALRAQGTSPISLAEISARPIERFSTCTGELDRLLGEGVVPGSLSLIGGDPGVGKSTLLLQICHKIAEGGRRVLYVSGEESAPQIALRASRIGARAENLYLLCETACDSVGDCVERLKPHIVVIDSIQTLYRRDIPSSPGSVAQLRETTAEMLHLAKGTGTAIFLIGHVTKSGEIAGPRLLEHMVDVVLYFEGDKHLQYRVLRVIKNRFGPADEIALFQMAEQGLVEVANPSQVFLQQRNKRQPGSAILPTMEGSRAVLVEVQALVGKTQFATPARRCAGLDVNRLALLLAVAEKHLHYPVHQCDVFVSVAGGLRISEPAIDLAVLCSIASSLEQKAVDSQTLVLGEVGLGGEMRAVAHLRARLKEGSLMGFERCVLPAGGLEKFSDSCWQGMQLIGVDTARQGVKALLR